MRFDHLILAAHAWGGPRSEMATSTKAAQTGGTGVRMCHGLYSNAEIPVNENRQLAFARRARMHDADAEPPSSARRALRRSGGMRRARPAAAPARAAGRRR